MPVQIQMVERTTTNFQKQKVHEEVHPNSAGWQAAKRRVGNLGGWLRNRESMNFMKNCDGRKEAEPMEQDKGY